MKADTVEKVVQYTGTELNTKGWQQEAALRMLMNNLHAEVAEHPESLSSMGGLARRHEIGSRLTRLFVH